MEGGCGVELPWIAKTVIGRDSRNSFFLISRIPPLKLIPASPRIIMIRWSGLCMDMGGGRMSSLRRKLRGMWRAGWTVHPINLLLRMIMPAIPLPIIQSILNPVQPFLSQSYLESEYCQAEWASIFNYDPTGKRAELIYNTIPSNYF